MNQIVFDDFFLTSERQRKRKRKRERERKIEHKKGREEIIYLLRF